MSKLVSIGGSGLVADASGAPVLRDWRPDRPAGHGKADDGQDGALLILYEAQQLLGLSLVRVRFPTSAHQLDAQPVCPICGDRAGIGECR